MEISKEQVAELKKRYGDVYQQSLDFQDGDGNPLSVEFVYRKPRVSDIEAYQKAAPKSGMVANQNLMQTVIVHPEPASVMAQVVDFPNAIGRFVEDSLVPFFGANVVARSTRL